MKAICASACLRWVMSSDSVRRYRDSPASPGIRSFLVLNIRVASSAAPTFCSSTIARPPDAIASRSRAQQGGCPLWKHLMWALPDDIVARNAEETLGRAVGEHVLLAVDVLDSDHRGNVLNDSVEELARTP